MRITWLSIKFIYSPMYVVKSLEDTFVIIKMRTTIYVGQAITVFLTFHDISYSFY